MSELCNFLSYWSSLHSSKQHKSFITSPGCLQCLLLGLPEPQEAIIIIMASSGASRQPGALNEQNQEELQPEGLRAQCQPGALNEKNQEKAKASPRKRATQGGVRKGATEASYMGRRGAKSKPPCRQRGNQTTNHPGGKQPSKPEPGSHPKSGGRGPGQGTERRARSQPS